MEEKERKGRRKGEVEPIIAARLLCKSCEFLRLATSMASPISSTIA
jgi:hypothetical protein